MRVWLFIASIYCIEVSAQVDDLGVIGDSGVTGVLSHGKIEATFESLIGLASAVLARGGRTPSKANGDGFQRIYFTPSEENESFLWERWYMHRSADAAAVLDDPKNSFGRSVAKFANLGRYVLVGQDGATVESIPRQLKRLQEGKGKLPNQVLISFTANDFCSASVLDQSPQEFRKEFRRELEAAWMRSEEVLQRQTDPVRFLVLAPFDVENLLTNPRILSSKIRFEGAESMTCREARQQRSAFGSKAWFVERVVRGICPSITMTRPEETEKIRRLREIQNQVISVWIEQIEKLKARYRGFAFEFTDLNRKIDFSEGDVAADCFHPSDRGHEKIAQAIAPLFKSRAPASGDESKGNK